uniref:chitinase n=1 Tax=Locusta migratoria TaxID=7004 RepID=A0A1L2D7Z1_LOCMI|nr:chitinase Cht10 [Locusta migratoria]
MWVCLVLVLATAAGAAGLHVPPPDEPSFVRDSVEAPPGQSVWLRRSAVSARLQLQMPPYGSRRLPLRQAVESPPLAARLLSSERLPLRDAVEHVPYEAEPGAAPAGQAFSLWRGFGDWLPENLPSTRQFNHSFLWWHDAILAKLSLGGPRNKPSALQAPSAHNTGIHQFKVVCFVEGWAGYRREPMRFTTADIDPFACTHIIYAFAVMDPHDLHIKPQDEQYDIIQGGYRSIVGLKRQNPQLKVMISVGGWPEERRKFAEMTASASTRREFIRSVLHFIDEYGFDGIDLDWEYPGAEDMGGMSREKEHFSLLVEELAESFAPRGNVLSASVSPSRFRVEDGYDVARLARRLDFINLMAFDLLTEQDAAADHHAPLTQRKHDYGLAVFYNVDYAVRYWLRKGARRDQLVVGIPFHGHSFTLKDEAKNSPGAPVKGLGKEGPYTQEKGFLAYFEILQLLEEGHWKKATDDVGSPYMVKGNQWIGYEDQRSVATKIMYIKKNLLGGAMVWALDLDDFDGEYGQKWPLLSVVKNGLLGPSQQSEQQQTSTEPVLITPPVAGVPVSVDSNQYNCSGRGYVRDSTNCNVYHRCEWGMKHTYICPEGLHYDSRTQLCDWPQIANCPMDNSSQRVEPENQSEVACSEEGLMEDPEDCRKYYMCHKGVAQHYSCMLGQYFNLQKGICEYGSCTPKNSQENIPSSQTRNLVGEDHYKVVCYYASWAWYRKEGGKFVPEHIDPTLCTHIVYAYASLDPNTLTMKYFDERADKENNFYERLTELPKKSGHHQQHSSDVTVMIGLGGWTDSAGDKYSRLVSEGSARRRFVSKTVEFLQRHRFGGLHLDWDYPRCWQSNCGRGPTSDKPNFTKLVQELRQAFKKQSPPLALAISISGYHEVIDQAYDLAELGRNTDFMSVMTYDYHGSWEKSTGHVSPLYHRSGDIFPMYNTNDTMEYLVSKGAPRDKLLVGIPFYGQSYTLENPSNHDIGSPATGPGLAGEFTMQPGMLAYYEICDRVRNNFWKIGRDRFGATGPFAYAGNQWVSFEDTKSVKEKAKYIKNMGYGGAMTFTLDLDDFENRCCRGAFPLLRSINRVFGRLPDSAEPTGDDCTRPPPPVTPPPPTYTTGVDSGDHRPTTPISTTHQHPTTPKPSTTEYPWWTPSTTTTTSTTTTSTTTTSTTTTPKPTTRPTTTSTTEYPWWTPSTTSTTKKPSTTSSTTTSTTEYPWWTPSTTSTTRKPPTTRPTTTSTTEEYPWWTPSSTTKKPTTTSTTERPWWTPPTTTTTSTAAPTTTVPTTEKPWSTTSQKPLPPDSGPCEAGVYYPDPTNCNAYYRCVLGQLRKEYCAGGLHWNPDKKVCDWPSESNCDTKEPSQTTGSTTTSSTTEYPWWTPSKPSETEATTTTTEVPWWSTTRPPRPPTTEGNSEWVTTSKPTTTQQPSEEVSECVNGQYYPVPGSCKSFYICVNGRLIKQTCAPGLVWNQDQTMCDWGFNVKCAEDSEREAVHKVQPDDPCDQGALNPYPGDCTRYLYCQWGRFHEADCAAGLHWNEMEKICDWPENAKCTDMESGSEPPAASTQKPVTEMSTSWTTAAPTTKPPWTWATTTTMKPLTTTSTRAPPAQGPPISGYFKVVCYFTNWAWYRRGLGKYVPEDIDANLCTHIVYGFAVLDYENLIIKAHDSWADFDNKFYQRVVAYKKKGLKVSLAIGGWNDSAGDKYSRLVNSPSARRRFIKHVLEFLEKYDFDGLDLDWEYPVCWQVDCAKGPASDKSSFAALVKELRQAFEPKGLLLSSAVSPSKTVIDAGYDVKTLAENLDWIAVMTYDFHGQWDKKTGHVAPLYFHPDDDFYFFNANFSINYWISEGAPRRKIVMGMPLYGQSFQLEKASTNGLNARSTGPGQAGEFTRAAGFLAYYEICDRIKNKGWTVVQDPERRMGPYAFKGNQWVSFDDVATIRQKSEYIRKMGLGGGMIWALDLDDFRNRCGGGTHPLLNTIRTVLAAPPGGDGATEMPPSWSTLGGGQPTTSTEEWMSSTSVSSTEMTDSGYQSTEDSGGVITSVSPTITTTNRPAYPGTTSSPPVSQGEFKVVCYFTNWAWYRQGVGKYLPNEIDPDLCTHIVYGFAVLNGDRLTIKPHDTWADYDNKFYEKVTEYKKKGIKVLVAIGGWNDSAGDKYSRLVNNPGARRRFIEDVIDFIEQNNFDGLDLDWEYPKCWQVDCKKGPESDKEAFAAFVRELRAAFNPKGWLLTSAVSPSKAVVDAGYDVPTLSQNLDWIAVMTYDFHGQWDKITGHVAPMYTHPEDVDVTFNANFSIHYWIQKGASPKKIVMGMPMYGQSFSLADNSDHGLNAPTYGGGEAGESTRARGFLSYYEICTNIQKKGWKVVKDPEGRMGPYAYLRDQWVSFDDTSMIRYKSNFIKRMGLGGGMIWALDLDDFRNVCSCEKYPLLKTINRVLRGYPGPGPNCDIEATEKPGSEETDNRIHPTTTKPTTNNWNVISGGSGLVPKDPTCGNRLFAPHDTDCNKYYLCQYGDFMEQSCPQGLYWNKDHCDWPSNTDCSKEDNSVIHPMPIASTQEPEMSSTTENIQMPESTVTTSVRPSEPGTSTVMTPTGDYMVVCYFTNWAWYRQGIGKYLPSDIDTSLCTHIAYGFAVLDGSTLTIKPHDSWADLDNEFYTKVSGLKKKGIKVLLAIGGWNDSLGDKYSRLANNPSARRKFVEHVVKFIEKYGFEGLDLDWEYPKCWQVDCNAGPDSDKQGFADLVKELSIAFKPRGLLLSSAVSPSKVVIDSGYDVPVLSQYFDYISVMTYDFHGHWDKQTGHVAPLYYYPGDTYDYFNANFTMHYWIEKGADRKKLIMGMPMYGQSFSLADAKNHGLNAKSYGPGEAGEFTRAGGFMAYYEICYNVKNKGWTTVRDPEGRIGPYAYRGNQWVSYDDVSDIRRKTKFIKELGLGGGMIWALDLDDFRNRCGCGTYPLLRTINSELRGLTANTRDCT